LRFTRSTLWAVRVCSNPVLRLLCFVDCLSPGPRKNDLTIYWALGPFVRSFTSLVDPGDIYPPHPPHQIPYPQALPCLAGGHHRRRRHARAGRRHRLASHRGALRRVRFQQAQRLGGWCRHLHGLWGRPRDPPPAPLVFPLNHPARDLPATFAPFSTRVQLSHLFSFLLSLQELQSFSAASRHRK
jgi:hypothetical protein